jgi:hypothetical protein
MVDWSFGEPQEEKTLSSEWRRRSALKKVLDTADIVRDVR